MPKNQGKSTKHERNKPYCEAYRTTGRRENNKLQTLKRHLRRHPHDEQAKKILKNGFPGPQPQWGKQPDSSPQEEPKTRKSLYLAEKEENDPLHYDRLNVFFMVTNSYGVTLDTDVSLAYLKYRKEYRERSDLTFWRVSRVTGLRTVA